MRVPQVKGRERGSSTYPSHHVAEYDHEVLHHVASHCHLLDVVVVDWQIVLVGAVSQHLVGIWLNCTTSDPKLRVFRFRYASFGAGMWLSLSVTKHLQLSLGGGRCYKISRPAAAVPRLDPFLLMSFCIYLFCGLKTRLDFARLASAPDCNFNRTCSTTLAAQLYNYAPVARRFQLIAWGLGLGV